MTSATDAASERRAGELLSRMTLVEKVAQLHGVMAPSLLEPAGRRSRLENGIGHVSAIQMSGAGGAHAMAELANSIQRDLLEKTRLGIPAIIHNEALSGVVAPGFTAFPTPIALAAAWDAELVERMADVLRQQMLALGQRQALSPVVDIARDARWGRVHETYGEDPLLTSTLAVHFVRGLQGPDLRQGVAATAKHFLGYGASEGGLNTGAVRMGRRELLDIHAVPFEAMIKEAGLESIMNSYSEIDGAPVLFDRELLQGLLRDRFGFHGTVVSDYTSLHMLVQAKKAAADANEAGRLALEAGLDVELPEAYGFGDTLVRAVRAGEVDGDLVDLAVHRVLAQKDRLGLFEQPLVDADPLVIAAAAGAGRELADALADASVTLLKNDGILPLSAAVRRIAVIGPHAASAVSSFGNYTYPATIQTMQGMMSGSNRMVGVEGGGDFEIDPHGPLAETLRALATTDVEHAVRTDLNARSLSEWLSDVTTDVDVEVVVATGFGRHNPVDLEAVRVACARADLIVLAVGGRAGGAGWDLTEGEGTDSSSLELPAPQILLADAVARSSTPTVAALWMGRGYVLPESVLGCSAILTAYFGGPSGPRALARAITGAVNPSGKLPFTIPRSTGQVPIYAAQPHGSGYRRADAAGYAGYIDVPSTPRYAFGHGIGYTRFALGDLSARVCDEEIELSLDIGNIGDRAGDQVVQFYVDSPHPGQVPIARQLVAFARIPLDPGQRATITAHISFGQLARSDRHGGTTFHPGRFRFSAGPASDDLQSTAEVDVPGAPRDEADRMRLLPRVDVRTLGASQQP